MNYTIELITSAIKGTCTLDHIKPELEAFRRSAEPAEIRQLSAIVAKYSESADADEARIAQWIRTELYKV